MNKKKSLKGRAVAETRAFVFVVIYLTFLFGSFTVYRRLISSEFHVSYLHYGYPLLEALVLGKVLLVGRMFHLGERFRDRPRIIPVFWKTFCFSLLVMAFQILERIIEGWFRHKGLSTSFQELLAQGKAEILARVLMLYTALVPLFILVEISDVLGEGKLFALFFRRTKKPDFPVQSDSGSSAELHTV